MVLHAVLLFARAGRPGRATCRVAYRCERSGETGTRVIRCLLDFFELRFAGRLNGFGGMVFSRGVLSAAQCTICLAK
jgi:hypothetical protein